MDRLHLTPMLYHICWDMQRNRWTVERLAEAPAMSTRSYDSKRIADRVLELLNTDKKAHQLAMDHMVDKMMAVK